MIYGARCQTNYPTILNREDVWLSIARIVSGVWNSYIFTGITGWFTSGVVHFADTTERPRIRMMWRSMYESKGLFY